jgi:hypothetical protein
MMETDKQCDHVIGWHDWGYGIGQAEFRQSELRLYGEPDRKFKFCPDCGSDTAGPHERSA